MEQQAIELRSIPTLTAIRLPLGMGHLPESYLVVLKESQARLRASGVTVPLMKRMR